MHVFQCWDDAKSEDIQLTEVLRRYNARASFNLNFAMHGEVRQGYYDNRNMWVERLAISELRSVYDGFTIANHTQTHPRPLDIPIDEWRSQVVDCRKALQDFFQQPIEGFVYPFGDHDAKTAEVVREAGHLYARTVGRIAPDMAEGDPMCLHPDCHFKHPDFWDMYEAAKQKEDSKFYFWGHSYEIMTQAEWDAFERMIGRIDADTDVVWADLPEIFYRG